MCVCVMDSLTEGPGLGLLLLGAIAAGSAFVVTIVIVLVCVGCQRKKKSKHPPANGEKSTSVNMRNPRQPKLNSMSKSDTRLHEINSLPCNGGPKNRPASMDLLLLHSRRSQSDLRQPPPARQLPQIPTSPQGGAGGAGGAGGGGVAPRAGARDHTYTEVGLRDAASPPPPGCPDDGLYESVGIRDAAAAAAGETPPPPGSAPPPPGSAPPPPASASTPAAQRATPAALAARGGGNGAGRGKGHGSISGTLMGRARGAGPPGGGEGPPSGGNGSPQPSLTLLAAQAAVTAEYASIRKVRKVDKSIRKDNNGAAETDSQSSLGESPPAPPLTHSQEFPRKQGEPFHLHAFPKEAVFMGNGEQYIWKPPEDDDIITLHPAPGHLGENGQGQPTATEVSSTYSTASKPQKKKSPPENVGSKTLPRRFGGSARGTGAWGAGSARGGCGRGGGGQARSHEEPCYNPASDKPRPPAPAAAPPESDPAYATIDPQRKRERAGTDGGGGGGVGVMGGIGGSATLKPRKKPPQPGATGAPHGPPPAPPPRAPPAPPAGEHLYENVSDVKQGASSAGTTTIFTFNDGMEMYVTGL